MTREHWLFLLAVALFLGLMLIFALSTPTQSPLYRFARRLFWAWVMVSGCRMMGWMGMNALTLGVCAWLGWPGCAMLAWAGSVP